MFGFIGKSLLAVCGSLIITAYCQADMFQQNNNTPHQTRSNFKSEVQTIINKQQTQQQSMQEKAKEIIDAGLKPKYVPNYQDLTVNKLDNSVWFYFTKDNFDAEKVQEAINLARSHNLYPVIYYLSEQCSFANAQQAQQFFYQHGLQYIFTQNYSDNVEFELSCDQKILNQIKNKDDVYFKFMSIRGLHGTGYLNDFQKVYSSCFVN